MKHFATANFWYLYRRLPPQTCAITDKNFELLKDNPRHPSLHLKKVGKYFSVRVGLAYRALGVEVPEGVLWFWIGSHADYERMIA